MSSRHSAHFFAETLRDLYFEESTGRLDIAAADRDAIRLHFDRGMLYFAESSDPEDDIGRAITEAGLLPRSTMDALGKSSPSPIRLVSSIVEGRILAADEIAPVIREVIRRCVARGFSWSNGQATFRNEEASHGFFAPDVLFTFECIMEGIRSMARFGPLKEVLMRLPNRVRMGSRLFLPLDRLILKPEHGFVLSRVDGSTRIEEIAQLVPEGEEDEAASFLYGLAVLGILEFDPPTGPGLFSLREIMQEQHQVNVREEAEIAAVKETAARFVALSPEQVLEVDRDAPLPVARRAFERLRKQYQRGRFSDRVRDVVKSDLALIERRITEAFLSLQVQRLERDGAAGRAEDRVTELNPDHLAVRREMVKTEAQTAEAESRELAEKYFAKARDYYHEKDFFNAIEFCKLALKFGLNTAQVHLLMAMAYAKNPHSRWQRLAEAAFTTACDLDPWNADYRVALADFYRERGLDIRARKQYEKALEIMPSHPAAQAGVRRKVRR